MAPNTILLNVRTLHEKETALKAAVDVIPGMLLEYEIVSGVNKIKPLTVAATKPSPILVATEAPWRMGQTINDPYDEDGEQVQFHNAQTGDHLYLLLAAGVDVAVGAALESAGDGTLRAATTGGGFRALEAKDNDPGVGSAAVHIRAEVL